MIKGQMNYLELQDLKERIKDFRNTKTKYCAGDVLLRIRQKICDQMALIGYESLEEKSLELIFIKEFKRLIEKAEIKQVKDEDYIKLSEVKNAINIIKVKSIF